MRLNGTFPFKENLGPLHERCNACHMIMHKKNIPRHLRNQHGVDKENFGHLRERSNICHKAILKGQCYQLTLDAEKVFFSSEFMDCLKITQF